MYNLIIIIIIYLQIKTFFICFVSSYRTEPEKVSVKIYSIEGVKMSTNMAVDMISSSPLYCRYENSTTSMRSLSRNSKLT